MYEEDFATCDECGGLFTPKFRGATTCYGCWSQTAAGRAWKQRKEAERAYAQRGSRYSGAEQTQQQARSDAGASQTRTEYRDCPGFDLAMCRLLLQLSHPDKHAGSSASVKATQWLNDRMKELKGERR